MEKLKSDYIRIQQAADYLGMSVITLRRKIKDGSLRAYKPGKEILFTIEDLERFVRKHPAA